MPGDDAFTQWKDAMRAVARLPLGLPAEFRKKVLHALWLHASPTIPACLSDIAPSKQTVT